MQGCRGRFRSLLDSEMALRNHPRKSASSDVATDCLRPTTVQWKLSDPDFENRLKLRENTSNNSFKTILLHPTIFFTSYGLENLPEQVKPALFTRLFSTSTLAPRNFCSGQRISKSNTALENWIHHLSNALWHVQIEWSVQKLWSIKKCMVFFCAPCICLDIYGKHVLVNSADIYAIHTPGADRRMYTPCMWDICARRRKKVSLSSRRQRAYIPHIRKNPDQGGLLWNR